MGVRTEGILGTCPPGNGKVLKIARKLAKCLFCPLWKWYAHPWEVGTVLKRATWASFSVSDLFLIIRLFCLGKAIFFRLETGWNYDSDGGAK